jgi:4-hydroxy-3-methylbut-2-enyl diphosphate reductase
MKLILANPRGFCAGVYMGIDVVDQLLDICDQPIYVYHEIVHNKHVVNRFRNRGVTFVDDLEDVPTGAIVVFSAHGVSPAVRSLATQRKLTTIDATCPLVTKVHAEAVRYALKGYQILLVGHEPVRMRIPNLSGPQQRWGLFGLGHGAFSGSLVGVP